MSLSPSEQVWTEWGQLTRFLNSARMAFARERTVWSSLELVDKEAILSSPAGQGTYRVELSSHLAAIEDETSLLASVLIFSYAITESAVADRLMQSGLTASGGIEAWGASALAENGKSWANLKGGLAGIVEATVVRNAFAHGTRSVSASDEQRLIAAGASVRPAGSMVTLTYPELLEYRYRLRELLRFAGFRPGVASADDAVAETS